MPQEIERKFLVRPGFRPPGKGVKVVQGYLPARDRFTARVRLKGAKAFLTLKGPSKGFTRDEYEYEIPPKDARELLAKYCGKRVVAKRRYEVRFGGRAWEVDVFEGRHRGLVLAELELPSESTRFPKPDWLAREVTGVRRYDNSSLAKLKS